MKFLRNTCMQYQNHDLKCDIFKQIKIIHLAFIRLQLYAKKTVLENLTFFAYCRFLLKGKKNIRSLAGDVKNVSKSWLTDIILRYLILPKNNDVFN